jgi:hypothetical protein
MKKLISDISAIPEPYQFISILWLSFLMAGVATGIFFSVIDPMQLEACVDFPEMGRIGAYTTGFFLFWILTAASSLLSCYFILPRKGSGAGDQSKADQA